MQLDSYVNKNILIIILIEILPSLYPFNDGRIRNKNVFKTRNVCAEG